MTGATLDQDDDVRTMLADAARTALQRLGGTDLSRAIQRRSPGRADELWAAFRDQGWLGILMPEAVGGSGLGVGEAAVVAAALGNIAVASTFSTGTIMASAILGDPEVAEGAAWHARQLLEGRARYAMAWGETRFPDEDDRRDCTLSGEDGQLTVTGTKMLVATEGDPDAYIVSCVRDGAPALCIVAANAPGLRSTVETAVDGTDYRTVVCEGAPMTLLLAEGEAARRLTLKAEECGLLCASAELYGLMSAALDLTLNYMRTRVQFDRPIGSFQALQHRAADLFIQQDLSFSVLCEALAAVDEGVPEAERFSAVRRAKARCSDAAIAIVKDAVQLHGAIGYTDEYDLSCYLKRAMVLSSWAGDGRWHRRACFRAAQAERGDQP